jgi:hypothetical protein
MHLQRQNAVKIPRRQIKKKMIPIAKNQYLKVILPLTSLMIDLSEFLQKMTIMIITMMIIIALTAPMMNLENFAKQALHPIQFDMI